MCKLRPSRRLWQSGPDAHGRSGSDSAGPDAANGCPSASAPAKQGQSLELSFGQPLSAERGLVDRCFLLDLPESPRPAGAWAFSCFRHVRVSARRAVCGPAAPGADGGITTSAWKRTGSSRVGPSPRACPNSPASNVSTLATEDHDLLKPFDRGIRGLYAGVVGGSC